MLVEYFANSLYIVFFYCFYQQRPVTFNTHDFELSHNTDGLKISTFVVKSNAFEEIFFKENDKRNFKLNTKRQNFSFKKKIPLL